MSEHTPNTELTPIKRALLALEDMRRRVEVAEARQHEPIAIVGMACRFPGDAADSERYWRLLEDSVDAVTEVPAGRWDVDAFYDPDPDAPLKTYSRAGGFLDDVEHFDSIFFGISPREAAKMDPQQRLLLEVTWEALERSGMAPSSLVGTRTGVFVGMSSTDYTDISAHSLNGGATEMDAFFGTGTTTSIAAGRISYVLGLQGPAIAIDTACSSSLAGVHLACQSLRAGESEIAVAGGVNLILGPWVTVYMSKAKAISPSGRCRTFDAAADGYTRGEGCGMVVLKRLSDAVAAGDQILAVIRGSAINHDGRSGGLTVPNGQAQQALIRAALADGDVDPKDVTYVEAHGTGTPLGDPIEMRAIDAAYGVERDEPLMVGSVKTNIGHLEAAAGIAGLIKVVLSLQHGAIPAHLHFQEPSPHIDWDRIGVRIPTELTPWPQRDGGRLAGISAFGFSGTNTHVVVGEAPPIAAAAPEREERPLHVLTLSARTEGALRDVAGDIAAVLRDPAGPSLPDAAHTLNVARNQFDHRVAVVAADRGGAADLLDRVSADEAAAGTVRGTTSSLPAPKVAFLFTGQGSQYIDMGRELYAVEPTFCAALDECDALLREHLPVSLLEVMHPEPGATSPIDDTTFTQPALFAIEYALARMWAAWGVQPDMVLGHSIGGYVAAHLAGVLTLPDALALVAARGRLMGALPEGGSMAAVFADEATVGDALSRSGSPVSIAALNGPQNTVVSGSRADIDALVLFLGERGIKSRPLVTSHAFHSALMEPALAEFERIASNVQFHAPRRRWMVSDTTGEIAGDDVATAAYWTAHIREAVRFADGVTTLAEHGCNVFLEIGPTPVLTAMGQRCIANPNAEWRASMQPRRPELEKALTTLAELWTRGVDIDWTRFDRDLARQKVALPTYRFQRARHWVEATDEMRTTVMTDVGHPLLGLSLDSALNALQFESNVGLHQPSFVADRTWHGDGLFSAGMATEMTLAAAAAAFGDDQAVRIEQLRLEGVDAITPEQSWRVQTVITPRGRSTVDVSIHGRLRQTGSPWQELASATVSMVRGAEVLEPVDPHALAAAGEPVDVDGITDGWRERGLDLGERARVARDLWSIGTDERWARLELPVGSDRYHLYPPLLDTCASLLDGDGEARAIERIGALSIVPGVSPAWCRIVRSGSGVDLQLYGADGTAAGWCSSVALVALPSEALPPRRDWCLDLTWQVSSTVTVDEPTEQTQEDGWIVIGDPSRGPDRIDLALFGGDDSELARRALANRLGPSGASHIVVVADHDDNDPAAISRSVSALIDIVRLVTDETWRLELATPPRLWLVTRGAIAIGAESPSPASAALWGVFKSAAGEIPLFIGGMLDVDPSSRCDWPLVRQSILDAGEGSLALRGDTLYRARVQHLAPSGPVRHAPLDAAGAHLVTGAFGALGFETARWVLRRGGRRLVLTSRSPVPARELWAGLDDSDPAIGRVAVIQELEALGASVEVASFDVADRAALDRFLEARRAAGGPPIVGVYHAAGVLRDRSILQLTPDDVDAVLSPKVQGTLNLHEALASEPLEHFVLFSSAAGALGSPGQANYAAANSFLDAFALVRHRAGLPATSVAWGPWDAGMAARDDLIQRRERTGIHPIPVTAGFDLLEWFTAADVTTAIVMPVSASRFAALFGSANADGSAGGGASGDRGAEILAAPVDERLGLVRRTLQEQIGVVLGLAAGDVAPSMSLMDLGLDSLTIVELGAKLGVQLGLLLDPREFFELPSVEQLAVRLLELLSQHGGAEIDPTVDVEAPAAAPHVTPRVVVLATVGTPVATLRSWFAGDATVTVEEDLADDVDALEQSALDPATRFVHVTAHPFVAIEQAGAPQRTAEEQWTTVNGNAIDLAERVGPARYVLVRFEDLSAAPAAVIATLGEHFGHPLVTDDAVAAAWDAAEAEAWKRVELGQRPGRSLRAVADELGYDVTWPRPGSGGQPQPPTPDNGPSGVDEPVARGDGGSLRPRPEAPAVPAALTRPILPVSRNERLEVSSAQERLLFLEDLQPGLTVYNMPAAFHVHGALDVAALESAFSEIVRRHEALRTNFDVVDGRYVQVVAKPVPVFFDLDDLRALPARTREAAVQATIADEAARPFDLRRDLKIRALLLQTGDQDHVLVTTMHHIAFDGMSLGLFCTELAALYEASVRGVAPALPVLPVQYADYAAWQRQLLGSTDLRSQLSYWGEKLGGDLPVLELPSDRPRSPSRTFASGTVAVDIPAAAAERIRAASRGSGVTPFMFLFGSYLATLGRWSGQDDLIVGTAAVNRPPATGELLGLFAETLALRVPVEHDAPFTDLLTDVKHALIGAFSNAEVPFERVVEHVRPRRDLSRAPIFQAMFLYNKQTGPLLSLPGFEVEHVELTPGSIEVDISVRMIDRLDGMRAIFEYSADLFDAATVERIVASWRSLLDSVVADPGVRLGSLPLLSEGDRHRLLEEWGRSPVDVMSTRPAGASTIHGLVSAAAQSSLESIAVRMGHDAISYRELEDRSERLARHLRGLGVGPGDLVGVAVERSVPMVVAVLGVLKAGAAYVPLDLGFPAERLAFMVRDAGVRVVLASSADVVLDADVTMVDVIGDWPAIEQADADLDGEAGGLAYVIYTSGSTGTPKGVEIEHDNVVNFLLSMRQEPGLSAADVLLGVTTLSFDISVLEIFLPLVTGAQLVIASRDETVDGVRLGSLVRSSGATVVQATPTTWSMLLESGWQGDRDLTALCGGEAMSTDLARQLVASCGPVWNMFGPTETTIWSTVFRVTPEDADGATIPIGQPIAGTVCRVLDDAGTPVPIGVPGELLIGGAGVARGYHGRPELTAERFVEDPFDPALRLYRTGDLARWRPDGTLECLGRLDQQVKVRGHRIELGEIESNLRAHAAVRDAVVVTEGAAHTARLVAFVIPTDPAVLPTVGDLRAWLQTRQPDYMIPSGFVPVDHFPLTPNRKIDRKALRPTATLPQEEAVEPRTELEVTLAEIWREVLGGDAVGVNQNFFDLGGYSLLATRVFALIEERTGHRLPISALFETPTVAGLAAAIGNEDWHRDWSSLVAISPEGTKPPFFYVAPYQISVLQFANLGRELAPDRPLYGFEPQGLAGDLPAHESIEEMAAHYITELKSVQPVGPYAVGGHCAGAWVAFEMARQLEAAGDELAAVVLVDEGPPLAERPAIRPLPYLAHRIRYYSKDRRFGYALKWKLRIAANRHLVRRLGPATERDAENVRALHRAAFTRYEGGRIREDLTLVRSSETVALSDKAWYLQWSDRTEGELHTLDVPGTHANLLERPYVEVLAHRLRKVLDRTDPGRR